MQGLLNVVAILSVILLVSVMISLRRAHIRVEHSVAWFAAALVLLLISTAPGVLDAIALWSGLSDGPTTLVFLAFVVFLVVLYRFSRVISDLKDANIALAQKLAILEFRFQTFHEKQQSAESR
jgi:hypothetical protein